MKDGLPFLGVGSVIEFKDQLEWLGDGLVRRNRKEMVAEVRPVETRESGKTVHYVTAERQIVHAALEAEVAQGRAVVLLATLPSLDAEKAPDGPVTLALANAEAARLRTEEEKEARELAYWQGVASSPGLVCVEFASRLDVAIVADEPKDYADFLVKSKRSDLGNGGRAFVATDLFGETSVTHNLWGPRTVPEKYAHLFAPTHLSLRSMTSREDLAYWAEKEESQERWAA